MTIADDFNSRYQLIEKFNIDESHQGKLVAISSLLSIVKFISDLRDMLSSNMITSIYYENIGDYYFTFVDGSMAKMNIFFPLFNIIDEHLHHDKFIPLVLIGDDLK